MTYVPVIVFHVFLCFCPMPSVPGTATPSSADESSTPARAVSPGNGVVPTPKSVATPKSEATPKTVASPKVAPIPKSGGLPSVATKKEHHFDDAPVQPPAVPPVNAKVSSVARPPNKRAPLEDELFRTESTPPPPLSESAIYNRLWRVFQKRKDGSYALDDRWCASWKDTEGGGREEIYALFEKVGYSADRVAHKKMFINSMFIDQSCFLGDPIFGIRSFRYWFLRCIVIGLWDSVLTLKPWWLVWVAPAGMLTPSFCSAGSIHEEVPGNH